MSKPNTSAPLPDKAPDAADKPPKPAPEYEAHREETLTQQAAAHSSLGEAVARAAVEKAAADSTVKPEDLPRALKDDVKLNGFEGVALAVALAGKLFGFFGDEKAFWERFGDEDDGGGLNKEELASAMGRIDRMSTTAERKKIIDAARAVLGSAEFRGSEVAGGNLACAQVVSTILVRCGYLENPLLGVSSTRAELVKRGWQEYGGPPAPGDVVVWNRTQKKDGDGNIALGHGHIGIVVADGLAISNSSSKKTPVMHALGGRAEDGYWFRRGIATFLRPPGRAVA